MRRAFSPHYTSAAKNQHYSVFANGTAIALSI